MGQQDVERRAQVIAALSPSSSTEVMGHAPNAVSMTPIVLGTVVFLVAGWWVLVALEHPYVDPSLAPGQVVVASDERVDVAFPADVQGLVSVFADPKLTPEQRDEDDASFEVLDQAGEEVPDVNTPDFVYSGVENASDVSVPRMHTPVRFGNIGDVMVPPEAEYRVSAPPGWSGRVSFVLAEDPPERPDWRTIVPAAAVALVAGGIAVLWTIKRVRWRTALARHKADLRAGGYDV